MKLGYMDQAITGETNHSGNMEDLPMSGKEKAIACILETKFHIEPATYSGSEVKQNPIMKDLIINRRVVKKKWTKRQRKEIIAGTAKSVGENQLVWLDTLKEEIAKIK
jgi:hypothetical protein